MILLLPLAFDVHYFGSMKIKFDDVFREFMVLAPTSLQKASNRTKNELTAIELSVLEQFSDVDFIDKLVNFTALQKQEEDEDFNDKSFRLFTVSFSLTALFTQ